MFFISCLKVLVSSFFHDKRIRSSLNSCWCIMKCLQNCEISKFFWVSKNMFVRLQISNRNFRWHFLLNFFQCLMFFPVQTWNCSTRQWRNIQQCSERHNHFPPQKKKPSCTHFPLSLLIKKMQSKCLIMVVLFSKIFT